MLEPRRVILVRASLFRSNTSAIPHLSIMSSGFRFFDQLLKFVTAFSLLAVPPVATIVIGGYSYTFFAHSFKREQEWGCGDLC